MAAGDGPPRSRVFLLTAREERGRDVSDPVIWRFILEDIRATGPKRVFATLEEAMQFLQVEFETADT